MLVLRASVTSHRFIIQLRKSVWRGRIAAYARGGLTPFLQFRQGSAALQDPLGWLCVLPWDVCAANYYRKSRSSLGLSKVEERFNFADVGVRCQLPGAGGRAPGGLD